MSADPAQANPPKIGPRIENTNNRGSSWDRKIYVGRSRFCDEFRMAVSIEVSPRFFMRSHQIHGAEGGSEIAHHVHPLPRGAVRLFAPDGIIDAFEVPIFVNRI